MKTKQFVAFAFRLSLVVGVTTKVDVLAQDVPAAEPSPESAGASGGNTGLNLDMKLDDLVKQDVVIPGFSQVVNTVDRQESTVGRSPAAIFVITPEMIKRSGARNIPDVLRMAPGVDVARINAHTWAISIRGFNNRYANKLLVQIDGRVVYNATFGGVYWEMQDVVLADVERIEVIRGPGTTMWGSNAMNGVINVITKKSSDTQGVLIQSGGGSEQERDFNTIRYGGEAADGLTWRVWGQQFDRAAGWSNTDVGDAWHMKHGGFRIDYTPTEEDTITLQGDLSNGYGGQSSNIATATPPFTTDNDSPVSFPTGNVLFRYGRVFDEETSWQIQTYYDRYEHNTASIFREQRDTYDIDLQYQFSPAQYHQFITGANYRNSSNKTDGTFFVSFDPDDFVTEWASVFAQDTMTLAEDRLYFTLGTRLEQNTFGGFQVEPTARLLFLPSERQSAWMAVSRAIRNPTRVNTQIDAKFNIVPGAPVFLNYLGNPNFEAENLMAYEIGYRAAPTDDFTWDIAGYINDYHKLLGTGPIGPPVIQPPGLVLFPSVLENNSRALSYGVEVTANLQITDQWRLYGSYSVFEITEPMPDPSNQVYLRSSWDLHHNVQFDLIGRYVDSLTASTVPKYIEMDTRIGWQATKTLEFSFVGQNLLDSHHLEFLDDFSGASRTEVRRSWYGMITWTY